MRVSKDKNMVVKQDEANPIALDVLATTIIEMQESIKRLLNSKIQRRALTMLIQDNARLKISQSDIGVILDSIETLADSFVKKRK